MDHSGYLIGRDQQGNTLSEPVEWQLKSFQKVPTYAPCDGNGCYPRLLNSTNDEETVALCRYICNNQASQESETPSCCQLQYIGLPADGKVSADAVVNVASCKFFHGSAAMDWVGTTERENLDIELVDPISTSYDFDDIRGHDLIASNAIDKDTDSVFQLGADTKESYF